MFSWNPCIMMFCMMNLVFIWDYDMQNIAKFAPEFAQFLVLIDKASFHSGLLLVVAAVMINEVLDCLQSSLSLASWNQTLLIIPMGQWPGNHFTESLWAHSPTLVKIYIALLWKTMIRSDHNFAHVTVVTCANLWSDWIIRDRNQNKDSTMRS